MSDNNAHEARAILSRTFSDLARVAERNATLRSVLEAIGGAIAPDGAVDGSATPRASNKRGTRSTPTGTGSRSRRTTRATPQRRTSSAQSTTAATSSSASRAPRRKPANRSNGAASPTGAGRVTRRDEVLAIITRQPGVTISAVAKELSVAPTGLYPVARRLEAEKRVKKVGTGWHPVKTK